MAMRGGSRGPRRRRGGPAMEKKGHHRQWRRRVAEEEEKRPPPLRVGVGMNATQYEDVGLGIGDEEGQVYIANTDWYLVRIPIMKS